MPDELRPEEMQDLWCNQPREPVGTSAEDVRRKARQFEAKTRRGFRVMAAGIAGSAVFYALLLSVFPGILQRIGLSLTLAAYVYCADQLRKRGAMGKVSADPPSATCAAYRAALARLRDFPFVSRFLVPFVPGPAVFLLGFWVPEFGVVNGVGLTTAVIVSPFVPAIPLLRRQRRTLQREIDELDALMREGH